MGVLLIAGLVRVQEVVVMVVVVVEPVEVPCEDA